MAQDEKPPETPTELTDADLDVVSGGVIHWQPDHVHVISTAAGGTKALTDARGLFGGTSSTKLGRLPDGSSGA